MGEFRIEFAAGIFLLFLLTLPLVFWLSRRGLSGLGKWRRWTAVVLRTLAVLCVVLALARTRLFHSNDSVTVFFVADRSYSILPEEWDRMRAEIDRASADLRVANGDHAGLILFGKEAGIEILARPEALDLVERPAFETLIAPEATDIQSAIRLAVAAFPEDAGAKRIVLFTDGNENRGEVLEEVRNARALGVSVDVVALDTNRDSEVWVEKVVVDPEVKVGEPFDLQVVVHSSAESRARVRLYENGAIVDTGGVERDLLAGKNVFTVRGLRRDAPGFHDYEVSVEVLDSEADRVSQNNRANAFVLIAGEPRVLVCLSNEGFAREQEFEQPLVDALREERIGVEVLPAEDLPYDAGEYLDYDAIILSNVAAHELTEARMKMIHGLVEGVGIGLVMIGGRNSFGAGGYQGTPIERLLPVDLEIKQKKTLPNGAIAFVVHSCELANGNWWARMVVQRAIQVLSPKDYCGVLFHDDFGGEKWLYPMLPCSQRQLMLNRLRNFQPGDMISFQQIFKMALQGLQATPASIKHLVILSDGDPTDPAAADVQAITSGAVPVTISTVCYGAHGNTIPPIMKKLAQKGKGKFYHLRDPKKLPEIILRETITVRKSLLSNEPFFPMHREYGPVLEGLHGQPMPQLGGYVLTSAKPLADLLLVHPPTDEDPTTDPLLATWTYGLGKSLAFTSNARAGWGDQWTGWENFQKFWSQAVRWVSRQRSELRGRISRQVRGERGKIIFDAIDETTGELDTDLRVRAVVVSPDHETIQVSGRQTRPGRYEFDVPAEEQGTYTVTLRYEENGESRDYTTGLSVPYSPEFRTRGSDTALLERLADASQGKFYENAAALGAADVFARDLPKSYNVQDIWRALLTAAVILFFADVFIRRVLIDFAGMARAVRRWLPGRSAVPAAEAPLGELLQKKAEARRAQASGAPAVGEATYEASDREDAPQFDAAGSASSPEAGGGKKPAGRAASSSQRPERKSAAPAPEEGGYTSRLLAAKRRALDGDKKGGGGKSPS